MGTAQSKQDGREKIFYSEIPLQFSAPLVQHLDGLNEDRVAAELRRLAEQENMIMREVESKIEQKTNAEIAGDGSPSPREILEKQIEQVRKAITSRPTIHEMDQSTKAARDDLVRCLRTHDRQPLNCWQEVYDFKNEVHRLEQKFVEQHQ